ncbi:MAG: regulatory iron-sulfur-containing complex subunit RicT [Anaerolineae bacterium]|jgi:cell fate regulator YaaT (PSP1 superfamily)|nr:regulatory iron-sulfur-containing complex subunit RicT [Anaerolineae bacterium]MDX9828753.1 regulatory iron-sulfur-containing complex subunit RicT [Anaerolineae bacterium]
MPLIVGVRFNPAGKVYYFDPTGYEDARPGEHLVVETSRGEEIGRVVIPPSEVEDDEIVRRLKGVSRRATPLDLTQMTFYRFKEREALARCQEKVNEHGLPMKMVRAEYNYDGSRLVFFFASETRVDFRRLVQDLARSFRARIELRQIGVRDEAKLLGGLGRCGLTLCCSTWLTEFNPVSIKMAKVQDLPLSPMDISGVCGRLLCCLAYESEHYAKVKEKLPKAGKVIDTPHGRGKVVQVNAVNESIQVELESQVRVEISYEELTAVEEKVETVSRRRRRRRREET